MGLCKLTISYELDHYFVVNIPQSDKYYGINFTYFLFYFVSKTRVKNWPDLYEKKVHRYLLSYLFPALVLSMNVLANIVVNI